MQFGWDRTPACHLSSECLNHYAFASLTGKSINNQCVIKQSWHSGNAQPVLSVRDEPRLHREQGSVPPPPADNGAKASEDGEPEPGLQPQLQLQHPKRRHELKAILA